MTEDEFVVKFKEFMKSHYAELSENAAKKISSFYELQKASGISGEELMLSTIHYAVLDAINKSLALALREIWNVKGE